MLKIAEYRFRLIVACLIAFCSVAATQGVLKTGSPVDIEVVSQKIYFSSATIGHHPSFSFAKDQTRHPEYPDDLQGIPPDLGERASVNEFYLLAPVSSVCCAYLANRPIRAPPSFLLS